MVVDTCLCGVLFFVCAFAFMFGSGHGLVGRYGLIGTEFFFLKGAPAT